jgi:histidyl-tRNA synthetase
MVRGLDYYTRTAFEVTAASLGSQNAVVGGGRYDGLIRDLGGPDIPGIGFAIGFERLLAMLPESDDTPAPCPDLFIVGLGDKAQDYAYGLCNRLRLQGVAVEMDYGGKSLKSQLKRADKLRCRYTLLVGDRELAEGQAALRNMAGGEQTSLPLDLIEEALSSILISKAR